MFWSLEAIFGRRNAFQKSNDMLNKARILTVTTLALCVPSAHATNDAAEPVVKTYNCKANNTEIIVSEKEDAIAAFVLSSCSRVGCMTLALDDPENGKLNISSSYLDGSTIDIATTARLSDDGILINSPIVVGQFGSDLTRLIGFTNQFVETYANPEKRASLNCQLHD